MWKVEIIDAKNSLTYREFFNSREAAIKYFSSLKDVDAEVFLEDVTSVDGECTRGEVIWIKGK